VIHKRDVNKMLIGNVELFRGPVRVITAEAPVIIFSLRTGPDLRYQNESVLTLLSNLNDPYDDLTRRIRDADPFGAGTSHCGVTGLQGTIGKEIDHGRRIWSCDHHCTG
jgi:hypothetical protein